MKILVTSGGTKIPIDSVRNITNMSTGKFGSKIASELLKLGHDVYFFRSKGSRSPMSATIDFHNHGMKLSKQFYHANEMYRKYDDKYNEMEYSTFDEYKERLERIIKIELPDVVILAAAVSDYGVTNPVNGKIRSNDMLTIKLESLPKIIYYIKEWHPSTKLVGFKLLVNSKKEQLENAAKQSISDNKCDMIVANDLADIKNDNHRIQLVFPNKVPIEFVTDPTDPNFLAKKVAEYSTKL